MSGAFQYKPKFVDIRVRPPKPEEEEAAKDVNALKPGQKPCDWPECRLAGETRAPKSRQMLDQHYWFCTRHAGEYNKSWDFFAGMSEGEVKAHQDARATGERPTWAFKASRFSREAAAFAAGQGRASDPFDVLGRHARAAKARARESFEERDRNLGKIERRALSELDLDAAADKVTIRARYTELLKRFHPDSNGGDRSAEHRLARVIRAYKTLKAAKLA